MLHTYTLRQNRSQLCAWAACVALYMPQCICRVCRLLHVDSAQAKLAMKALQQNGNLDRSCVLFGKFGPEPSRFLCLLYFAPEVTHVRSSLWMQSLPAAMPSNDVLLAR